MLADKLGIVFAVWFGLIVCSMSILCVLLTFPIEKAANTIVESQSNNQSIHYDIVKGEDTEYNEDESRQKDQSIRGDISWRDVLLLPHIFWVLVISCLVVYSCVLPFNNVSSSLLLERDYFQIPPG